MLSTLEEDPGNPKQNNIISNLYTNSRMEIIVFLTNFAAPTKICISSFVSDASINIEQ